MATYINELPRPPELCRSCGSISRADQELYGYCQHCWALRVSKRDKRRLLASDREVENVRLARQGKEPASYVLQPSTDWIGIALFLIGAASFLGFWLTAAFLTCRAK